MCARASERLDAASAASPHSSAARAARWPRSSRLSELRRALALPAAFAAGARAGDARRAVAHDRWPVTELGDALVQASTRSASSRRDVATLSRTEIGELAEGSGGGRRRCRRSRIPRIRPASAPPPCAHPSSARPLHLAAALAVDERPDGAWHAEWPTLRELLRLALGASAHAATLAGGLRVDADGRRTQPRTHERADRGRARLESCSARCSARSASARSSVPRRGEDLATLVDEALIEAGTTTVDVDRCSTPPITPASPATLVDRCTHPEERETADRPTHRPHRPRRPRRRPAHRPRRVSRHVVGAVGGRRPRTRRAVPRRRRRHARARRIRSRPRAVLDRRDRRRDRRGGARPGRAERPLRGRLAGRSRRSRARAAASGSRVGRGDRGVRSEDRRRGRVARARGAGAGAEHVRAHHRVGAAVVRARLDRAQPRHHRPAAARPAGRRRRELRAVLRGARAVRRARAARRHRHAIARGVGRPRRGDARGVAARDRRRECRTDVRSVSPTRRTCRPPTTLRARHPCSCSSSID